MRRQIGFLIALFSLFAFGISLADTVDTVWVRTFGMVGYRNWGQAITVDNAGNIYVAGEYGGNEYITIKYRSNGDTVWVRTFDGGSYATAVKVDAWGNVYVSGIKSSPPGGPNFNYYTIKYDSLGNQVWIAKDSCGGITMPNERVSLALDDSGNLYLTGYFYNSAPTYEDFLTVKRHPNGDTAWVRMYNGPKDTTDKAEAVAVDDSGNVYVTGPSGGYQTRTWDYCTIKYRANGDTAWVRMYNGSADDCDEPCGVAVDQARNVYVTGRSVGDSGGGFDYLTIKYRSNGDTAWIRRFSGAPGWSDDEPCGLVVDRVGNVTVTGYSDLGSGYDWCTVSYDSTGGVKWAMRYDGGFWDIANAISVDTIGNVYVTGESDQGSFENYLTIKYDTSGTVRWTTRYNNPGSGGGFSEGIALDDSGQVFVTGVYEGLCTTIKYVQYPSGVEIQRALRGSGERGLRLQVTSPASSALEMSYYLPLRGEAILTLYDFLGRRVKELVHGFQGSGEHSIKQRVDLSSGIYFLRLDNSGQVILKKVVVVR